MKIRIIALYKAGWHSILYISCLRNRIFSLEFPISVCDSGKCFTLSSAIYLIENDMYNAEEGMYYENFNFVAIFLV